MIHNKRHEAAVSSKPPYHRDDSAAARGWPPYRRGHAGHVTLPQEQLGRQRRIFTSRKTKIATSPFIYWDMLVFMPEKLGNLQPKMRIGAAGGAAGPRVKKDLTL